MMIQDFFYRILVGLMPSMFALAWPLWRATPQRRARILRNNFFVTPNTVLKCAVTKTHGRYYPQLYRYCLRGRRNTTPGGPAL